jgi:DNA-binding NtrC family response regulator
MFEEIVGSSRALIRVTDQIFKVAACDAAVLITGESGTGKS